MEIKAIRTPIVERGQDLVQVLSDASGDDLREKDVVCVTSKVVAIEQDRLVKISDVKPSPRARQMRRLKYSKDFDDHAQFAELVLQEAERIFEGEGGFVYLTLKNHIFIANAGIDLSNVPDGYAVLWPERPWDWVRTFRERLKNRYQLEHLGVLMTDSHLTPLRRGVTGLAVAYSGFEGVESQIGKPDLYGKPLHVTEKAIADDLASASVLLTGEAGESTPFAIIRGAPISFTNREIDPLEVLIDPRIDLYAGIYNEEFKRLLEIPTSQLP